MPLSTRNYFMLITSISLEQYIRHNNVRLFIFIIVNCSITNSPHWNFAYVKEEFMKKFTSFMVLSGLMCSIFLLSACKDEAPVQQAPPPPLVTVFEIKAADHPYNTNYQGVTQGSKAVDVRARVDAIITERLYVEGQYVDEGQILFQLERDQYEARVAEANAQYENAKREWNRVRPLYAQNALSQKDRDNAQAAYETAKANLRTAQINLDYCQVTAPVAGYTSKEEVTPGNLVNNGTLLTYVNQTNPLYVNFSVASTEYMRGLQLAAQGRMDIPKDNAYKAKIRLVDGTMFMQEGEVTFVGTQVDQTMGVIQMRATFDNSKGIILPGQYVRIFLEGAVLKNAILIPQKAVLITQKGPLVMVINKDNIVEMRPIQINMPVEQMYLLDGGLKDGERIVLEGLVKARAGQPVTIADPNAQKSTQGAGAAPKTQETKVANDNKESVSQESKQESAPAK